MGQRTSSISDDARNPNLVLRTEKWTGEYFYMRIVIKGGDITQEFLMPMHFDSVSSVNRIKTAYISAVLALTLSLRVSDVSLIATFENHTGENVKYASISNAAFIQHMSCITSAFDYASKLNMGFNPITPARKLNMKLRTTFSGGGVGLDTDEMGAYLRNEIKNCMAVLKTVVIETDYYDKRS